MLQLVFFRTGCEPRTFLFSLIFLGHLYKRRTTFFLRSNMYICILI
jgi:hypothetical protein